jgi:hypothetical protein
MKAYHVLARALLFTIVSATASASAAKGYAEADGRIEAESARLTGMRTKELAVALSRDWVGKKKDDVLLWAVKQPRELDAAYVTLRESSDAVILRISTEYPAGSELSAVFRFWLSPHGVVVRLQYYRDHMRKAANQSEPKRIQTPSRFT